MVEKGIGGGICYPVNNTRKLITNKLKFMIKIKNRHIFNIGMQKIYMDGQYHKMEKIEKLVAQLKCLAKTIY